MPNSASAPKRTPIFECCIVGCESKNRHKKDIVCFKEIGLSAQNLLPILGSTYDRLIIPQNLRFEDREYIQTSSETYEGSGYRHDLDLLIISH